MGLIDKPTFKVGSEVVAGEEFSRVYVPGELLSRVFVTPFTVDSICTDVVPESCTSVVTWEYDVAVPCITMLSLLYPTCKAEEFYPLHFYFFLVYSSLLLF